MPNIPYPDVKTKESTVASWLVDKSVAKFVQNRRLTENNQYMSFDDPTAFLVGSSQGVSNIYQTPNLINEDTLWDESYQYSPTRPWVIQGFSTGRVFNTATAVATQMTILDIDNKDWVQAVVMCPLPNQSFTVTIADAAGNNNNAITFTGSNGSVVNTPMVFRWNLTQAGVILTGGESTTIGGGSVAFSGVADPTNAGYNGFKGALKNACFVKFASTTAGDKVIYYISLSNTQDGMAGSVIDMTPSCLESVDWKNQLKAEMQECQLVTEGVVATSDGIDIDIEVNSWSAGDLATLSGKVERVQTVNDMVLLDNVPVITNNTVSLVTPYQISKMKIGEEYLTSVPTLVNIQKGQYHYNSATKVLTFAINSYNGLAPVITVYKPVQKVIFDIEALTLSFKGALRLTRRLSNGQEQIYIFKNVICTSRFDAKAGKANDTIKISFKILPFTDPATGKKLLATVAR